MLSHSHLLSKTFCKHNSTKICKTCSLEARMIISLSLLSVLQIQDFPVRLLADGALFPLWLVLNRSFSRFFAFLDDDVLRYFPCSHSVENETTLPLIILTIAWESVMKLLFSRVAENWIRPQGKKCSAPTHPQWRLASAATTIVPPYPGWGSKSSG